MKEIFTWRWIGVSAGLATLLVLALLRLARPRAEDGGTLLVMSQVDAKVYLIDPRSGRVRAAVASDPCPHEVP